MGPSRRECSERGPLDRRAARSRPEWGRRTAMDLEYGTRVRGVSRAGPRVPDRARAPTRRARDRRGARARASARWPGRSTLIENGYAARTDPEGVRRLRRRSPTCSSSIVIDEEFARAGVLRGIGEPGRLDVRADRCSSTATRSRSARYVGPDHPRRDDLVPGLQRARRRAATSPACAPTRRRDGDEFVINGQKIWTSTAREADMMFCLVRTEPDAEQARRHQLPPDRR